MTPKQKAEELVDSFMSYKPTKMSDYSRIEYPTAKAFALIAVDEIIEIAPKNTEQIKYSDGTYAREYREIPNRYWNEVKQEINKL